VHTEQHPNDVLAHGSYAESRGHVCRHQRNGHRDGAGHEQLRRNIDASSAVTGQFTNVDFLNNTLGDTFSVDYSHEAQGEVFLDVNAPVGTSATPEPAEFLPVFGGLCGLALLKIRKNARLRRQKTAE
jgi:hypothetical protein